MTANTATTIISELLQYRSERAGDGNRRSFYGAVDRTMDRLGDQFDPTEVPELGGPASERKVPVALRRIGLRNWKVFERADVVIPAHDVDRPVVLLGGANGYGKSSLLEAVAFGLFGKRVISELDHLLRLGERETTGRRMTYRSALESALGRTERARRDGIASVELAFDCADGGLVLQRKWYFDEAGGLIERDEELLLWVGEDRHLLEVPEGVPPSTYYQSEVERRVVSLGLAPFFLLDGEQIDRLADRKLGDQVRYGIERVLGLEAVTGLAADLRDYARDRGKDLRGHGGADPTLLAEVDRLEAARSGAAEQVAMLEAQLEPLKTERDALIERLAAPAGDSHADLQSLLEAERRVETERSRVIESLRDAMSFDIPIAMVGRALLAALSEALVLDGATDGAEPIGTDADLELLLHRLSTAEYARRTPVPENFEGLIRTAWNGERDLKNSQNIRHPYLDRKLRRSVLDACEEGKGASGARVADLLQQLAASEAGRRRALSMTQDRRRSDLERVSARERLSDISEQVRQCEAALQAAQRQLGARQAELEPATARLRVSTSAALEAAPRLRRAELARQLALLADDSVQRAAPRHFELFARAVTDAYRRLSHKTDVADIRLGSDGTVAIIDGAGQDISDLRRSAGESQLLAMALIAAVGELVGPSLPLIVDTPSGRLDTRHRELTLAMLTSRAAQTILLVQPEELGPATRKRIERRIAGTFEISYSDGKNGSIGTSVVRDGALAA